MRRHARQALGFCVRRAFVIFTLFCGLPLSVGALQQPAPPTPAPGQGPEWFTVNQDYSSQRYVDLDNINTHNVGQLTKICDIDLNSPTWFSSGLLMVGGTIYVNTVGSTFAVDATNCALRWRHDITFTPWVAAVSNRGATYYEGAIIRGTADGRVIALDTNKGTVLWQTQAADPSRHEAFTSAPVAWDDKVFIGIVTADLGVRGRLMAFDTNTGKELWRFNTIPIGIDKHADTWPPPSQTTFAPAGGAFWTSYSVDPVKGEVFGPVSNPNPDYVRPVGSTAAANLYTNSVISLNAVTGNLNWYCQTVAGDTHDWDLGTQPTLYRTKSGKEMLAVAGKEGYVIGIDRTSRTLDEGMCQKKILFRTPGTRVPAQPEPEVDSTLRLVCPGTLGGAQWNGTAYHPSLGILYSGMVDFCFYYSSSFYGADPGFWTYPNGQTLRPDFSKPPRGWITAMDGETGKVLWKYHADAQVLTGVVPTKGGLLFAGDVRGNLLALDAKNGRMLKRIDVGGALNHGLISYALGGRQYVAVAAGGVTLNPSGVSGPVRVVLYGLPEMQQANVLKSQTVQKRAPMTLITNSSDSPPATSVEPKDIPGVQVFSMVCAGCHGFQAEGGVYPPLLRHTELADDANNYQVLKGFLQSVPPPMPVLYPGLLNDNEVEALGGFLKTLLSSPANPQLSNSAPPGYIYTPPSSGGTPQWQAVYSVLTSPRCINCHTVTNYPRQRDIRYPHIYSVVRGTDDFGAPVARCQHCHGDKNNPATGIPGAKDWHIAPLSMAWESKPGIAMTGPQLCSMLKNPLLNGDRTLHELADHLETPLVKWAWNPGTRWNGDLRTKPPISHAAFVKAFREWADAGGPCPKQ
jgi:alcohol dehydrogenase (cytochrome c)